MGVSAPDSKVFDHNGETKYASLIIPNKGHIGANLTPDVAKQMLHGFAADVLLGNQDVLGMSNDNVVVGHDGAPHRIDNGGAMLFTAMGKNKPSSARTDLVEWDGFSNLSVNNNYAKIFTTAGVKDAASVPGIGAQIKAITALRDQHGGWENFIAQASPDMPLAQRQKTAQLLEDRTKLLQAKATTVAGGNSLVGTRIFEFDPNYSKAVTSLVDWHNANGVKMTKEQKAAINDHQGSGYASAASVLLGKASSIPPSVLANIKHLDEYFAQPGVQIGKDVALSRCIPMRTDEVDKLRTLAPGAIIGNTPIHQSTSTNSSVSIAGDDIQLCILAPKETPGVPMGAYSSSLKGEAEVLLPRGLSYRVVAVMNPGDPDHASVPSGWSWRPNAKNKGVRLVVEPIIPGVNDVEHTAVPVHHIDEASIASGTSSMTAKGHTVPATPNISQVPIPAPWNSPKP